MKALRGFTDTMTWTETGKRTYALHAGSDIVATLSWPRRPRGGWPSSALASCDRGSSFARRGRPPRESRMANR